MEHLRPRQNRATSPPMEIERKYRAGDFGAVKTHIVSRGFKHAAAGRLSDIYYIPKFYEGSRTDFDLGDGVGNIRLRHDKDAKSYVLDLKYISADPTKAGIITEHECLLQGAESFAQAAKIIDLLGYKELCVIDKMREVYKSDDMKICLDEVADLGNFIELEIIAPATGAEAALARIDSLAQKLGLKEEDRIMQGYVTLSAAKT